MLNEERFINWLIILCFVILSISFVLSDRLLAQNQEKDTKKNTLVKTGKTNNITEITQNENIENIKPPEGEQWIAPGDERLYKFDINPITLKKGITGGVLIFYGHYIRPPYKVEIKKLYQNGYEAGIQVIINGLVVYPHPDVIEERFFKKEKKTEIVLNEYEKKCYRALEDVSTKILKDLKNIVIEIGLKPENIKIIEKKFEDYLSHSQLISYYKLKSIWSADIIFSVCNEDPRFNNPETIIFDWGFPKPEKSRVQHEKELWEQRLKRYSLVTYINIGDSKSYDISELDQVAEILLGKMHDIDKIKTLYTITFDLQVSKSFFYNFEYKNYLQDRKIGLVK